MGRSFAVDTMVRAILVKTAQTILIAAQDALLNRLLERTDRTIRSRNEDMFVLEAWSDRASVWYESCFTARQANIRFWTSTTISSSKGMCCGHPLARLVAVIDCSRSAVPASGVRQSEFPNVGRFISGEPARNAVGMRSLLGRYAPAAPSSLCRSNPQRSTRRRGPYRKPLIAQLFSGRRSQIEFRCRDEAEGRGSPASVKRS